MTKSNKVVIELTPDNAYQLAMALGAHSIAISCPAGSSTRDVWSASRDAALKVIGLPDFDTIMNLAKEYKFTIEKSDG